LLLTKKPDWLVPAGLLALSAVPVAAGSARVAELSSGAAVTADNARFFDMPLPVVLHIFAASIYCILGAFQFVPALRRRHPGWHRGAGRVLIPCGLLAALTGLWMTLFYDLPPGDGDLLGAIRLFFGTAMIVSIVLAVFAIRRRDIAQHRAWMTRGYAIGLGAGTQVFTHVPYGLLVGVPGEFARAMLMAAGWVINLVVAEWALRRRVSRPVPRPA
jgi:uncharacterized membrane protein